MTRTERDDPPWSILERGTGDWRGEETMPPAPWAPEGLEAVGTLTAKLVFGGRGEPSVMEGRRDRAQLFEGRYTRSSEA